MSIKIVMCCASLCQYECEHINKLNATARACVGSLGLMVLNSRALIHIMFNALKVIYRQINIFYLHSLFYNKLPNKANFL